MKCYQQRYPQSSRHNPAVFLWVDTMFHVKHPIQKSSTLILLGVPEVSVKMSEIK